MSVGFKTEIGYSSATRTNSSMWSDASRRCCPYTPFRMLQLSSNLCQVSIVCGAKQSACLSTIFQPCTDVHYSYVLMQRRRFSDGV